VAVEAHLVLALAARSRRQPEDGAVEDDGEVEDARLHKLIAAE
jgi:hypothetical protein